MARADLLTSLVKYGMSGDKARFKKVAETIITEERSKQHTVLANRLESLILNTDFINNDNNSKAYRNIDTIRVDNLVQEIYPDRTLKDIVLPNDIRQICEELITEHHRSDLLRSYSLEPRNRILLIGPPGNGKTSLAEAIAESLMVPLLVVRYEGVVGTYLGETANRLRKIIDYACTRDCVLFFDEFETLGKERGDTHETGEIKRVVSSLLLQIDSLPSRVVVIGATNHPELLDRAVWRRFQIRVELPKPTQQQIEEWIEKYCARTGVDLEYPIKELSKRLYGNNFAEIEEFFTSILRRFILNQPEADMKSIVDEIMKSWTVLSVKE